MQASCFAHGERQKLEFVSQTSRFLGFCQVRGAFGGMKTGGERVVSEMGVNLTQ